MAAASRGQRSAGKFLPRLVDLSAAQPTATTWAGENSIFSQSMRVPIASLLSQLYGKPVELRLTKLARPHLNASILAAVTAERMRGRTLNEPRKITRDLVSKVALPGQADVPSTVDKQRLAVRRLSRKPSLASLGTPRSSIGQVLRDLSLKRVTHIGIYIGGRYANRLSADRAARKIVRSGITTSGPGTILRQVRKSHITYARRAGKKRVGAFGIKVWLGHS